MFAVDYKTFILFIAILQQGVLFIYTYTYIYIYIYIYKQNKNCHPHLLSPMRKKKIAPLNLKYVCATFSSKECTQLFYTHPHPPTHTAVNYAELLIFPFIASGREFHCIYLHYICCVCIIGEKNILRLNPCLKSSCLNISKCLFLCGWWCCSGSLCQLCSCSIQNNLDCPPE